MQGNYQQFMIIKDLSQNMENDIEQLKEERM